MKISSIFLLCSVVLMAACAGVKTRKQAAEEAKTKRPTENAAAPVSPIDEDDDAPVSGVQTPVDDPVLDDELAAMGIEPSGAPKTQTPEPEAAVKKPAAKKPAPPAKKKKPKKK